MTLDAPSDSPFSPSEGVVCRHFGRVPLMSAYRAMAGPRSSPAWTCSPFAGLVPQESGDRFTRCVFERRYAARPDVRKVELEMVPEQDGW